jgi:hypothetical protein
MMIPCPCCGWEKMPAENDVCEKCEEAMAAAQSEDRNSDE